MEQFLVFLQKNPFNLVLFFAVVVSGSMLIWPLLNRLFRPGNEIGTMEAVQLINRRDAVVIDVREPAEYASGHIANARNIPEAQIGSRMKELEKFKARPVIVSCNTGSRSLIASATLRKTGFTEAVSLKGGITAWRQASMPLQR